MLLEKRKAHAEIKRACGYEKTDAIWLNISILNMGSDEIYPKIHEYNLESGPYRI